MSPAKRPLIAARIEERRLYSRLSGGWGGGVIDVEHKFWSLLMYDN